MNVASKSTLNQTIQVFALHLEKLVAVGNKFYSEICEFWKASLSLTPLQFTLLKVLIGLLVGTVGFIWYAWRVYGEVITEKFVRPSTLKEIEELKLSVAKLKLPKEHSPRI